MPIHPAPVRDLAGLIEGYRQTTQAVIDLGHSCSAEDFARSTSCPGWTLQDHIAHVVAVEQYLEGGENPEVDVSHLPHVRHEFAAWMEQGVEARRGRPGPEVVAELEEALAARLATLTDPELTLDTEVQAPMGRTMRLSSLLKLRQQDIWVHEQDIREVLGRLGDLDSPAAVTFVNGLVTHFPTLMGGVELADGQTVILESTGPVTARTGVRVGRGEDGEITHHPLFTGENVPGESGDDPSSPPHSEGDPTTTISMSTEAMTRRAAGRQATADSAYTVVGDEELAVRVLDAIALTP